MSRLWQTAPVRLEPDVSDSPPPATVSDVRLACARCGHACAVHEIEEDHQFCGETNCQCIGFLIGR
jgi:hypothetical protein